MATKVDTKTATPTTAPGTAASTTEKDVKVGAAATPAKTDAKAEVLTGLKKEMDAGVSTIITSRSLVLTRFNNNLIHRIIHVIQII
jgi:hypothetical protein